MKAGTPRGATRDGFTLIELLVAASIIALVVAFALPAIQASREASRRAMCANNLKQLGLALAGHVASAGRYPSGILPSGHLKSGALFGLPGSLSLQAQILPFVDQAVMFNGLNIPVNVPFSLTRSGNPYVPANSTILACRCSVFLCPSDSGGLDPGGNYRGCVGSLPYALESPPGMGGGGVFPGLLFLAEGDITDGLSQTAGISERVEGSGAGSSFSRSRDIWFSSLESLGPLTNPDTLVQTCASLSSPSPPYWPNSGRSWGIGGFADTLYNHLVAPNGIAPDCSAGPPSDEPAIGAGVISARSRHSKGVNVLFMDGSVRFVVDGISLPVWRSIGTRVGREAIGSDF